MKNGKKYLLDEKDMCLMEKVQEATWTNYDIENNSIPVENLLSALDDLLREYQHVQEELNHIIEDRNENWKQILYQSQI